MEFNELIEEKKLLQAISKMGFRRPMKVQEEVYGRIKEGESLFVQAPTGTGKTLAYLLPLFAKYKKTERENKVIILAPTSELALQIHRQITRLSELSGIKLRSACVTGSTSILRQKEKLKEKPEFIVGTTNRIHSLIKDRKIAAHLIKTIVLDEGDRLFDKNNKEMTDAVIKCLLRDRQLLLFSATKPEWAVKAAQFWDEDLLELSVEDGRKLPENIKHWYVVCEEREKLELFRGLTSAIRTKKAMVFLNGSYEMEKTYEKLKHHNYSVALLGGGKKKDERKFAMQSFLKGRVKYLIASDLAARGLQFDDVDTVFHLNLPEDALMYLHRAGRTGRAMRVGRNLVIVTKKDLSLLRFYERELGIKFSEKFYYDGKLMDVPKKIDERK